MRFRIARLPVQLLLGAALIHLGLHAAAVFRADVPVKVAHAAGNPRLQARYLVAADGARAFQGWHDTQRNEDCTFRTLSDGVKHCIPPSRSAGAPYTLTFSDAACTKPVLELAKGAPLPAAADIQSYDACDEPILALHTPGAKLSKVYALDGANKCAASPLDADTTDYYAVGAVIPPTSFAEGKLEVAP